MLAFRSIEIYTNGCIPVFFRILDVHIHYEILGNSSQCIQWVRDGGLLHFRYVGINVVCTCIWIQQKLQV